MANHKHDYATMFRFDLKKNVRKCNLLEYRPFPSGNRLFYKAEYRGKRCLYHVWVITLEWGALPT